MIFVTHQYRVRQALLSAAVVGGAAGTPRAASPDPDPGLSDRARSEAGPARVERFRELVHLTPVLGSRVEVSRAGG